METQIKTKGSLTLHIELNKLIQKITVMIHEIPNYQALKNNHDLTLYVLNLITTLVKNKKLDIPTIASTILTDVFNLNTEEKDILDKQIAYLISSGNVKKISKLYYTFNGFKKSFFFF
jgi:hypothetical protein